MIRLVLVGLWAAIVALCTASGVIWWQLKAEPASAATHADPHAAAPNGLQQVKTRSISVPMIADGEVKGYIVAQFTMTADAAGLKALSVPPEPFLLDEAFRAIYASKTLDFRHLNRFDLGGLTTMLVGRLRERLGADIVRDVLVQEFTYVSKADIRK